MIPCAVRAISDKRLRGAPREVYFWLHERLDVVIYRRKTVGEIALGTSMRRKTVHDAVLLLLELGYLERIRGEGREWLYRLVNAPE